MIYFIVLVCCLLFWLFFFFKQKTAYEMRISDWSSDVCSSDLLAGDPLRALEYQQAAREAQAFKDEGYPKKSVPLAVSAWVIKGRTARQAAEQILAKAAERDSNLLALRELRLKAKTQIRAHIARGKAALATKHHEGRHHNPRELRT